MNEKLNEKKNETKLYHAAITVVLMIVIMFTAIVKYDADPQIPLVFGCLVAGSVSIWIGYSWTDILNGMLKGISNSLEAILILLLIGILVGVWIACGTVPTMIFYGLKIVSAKFFLPATMIICTIVAFAIGSWGTVGTVGLAFMGIGIALQIPAPMVAGCVVSGAYMGEVVSPLSDATNLTAAVIGENVFDIVRRMMKIALVVFVITTVGYLVLGLQYASGSSLQISDNIDPLLASIKQNFEINALALLPMLLMALGILMKFPAIPAMLLGIISGMVEAVFMQHMDIGQIFEVSYDGYVSNSGQELLDSLLSAGGMEDMLYAISIIIIAMSFGGIMQHTKQMEALISPMVRKIQSSGGITALTVVSCIGMNILLPDQYLGISLPGQMYEDEYEKRKINKLELGRTLLGGGAVTSPLIPWNTCGIYVMTILSVAPTAYAPYAFYSLLLPVAIIIAGFFNKNK